MAETACLPFLFSVIEPSVLSLVTWQPSPKRQLPASLAAMELSAGPWEGREVMYAPVHSQPTYTLLTLDLLYLLSLLMGMATNVAVALNPDNRSRSLRTDEGRRWQSWVILDQSLPPTSDHHEP